MVRFVDQKLGTYEKVILRPTESIVSGNLLHIVAVEKTYHFDKISGT
jgi:hypothetical protein